MKLRIQDQKFKLGIIGAGVMGKIFIDRLLKTKTLNKSQILVSRRSDGKKALVAKAQILILAVKPQDFAKLADELVQARVKPLTLIISIMAGIDIWTIQKSLNIKTVVRAMPNLPAKVGKGATVWKASSRVTQKQKAEAKQILQSLGVEIEVKQEKMIDLATAVSGSGPAYVFLFQELLAQAGQSLGLPKKLAQKLALQTFWGAVSLQRESESGIDPQILRKQVTSKAGTTQAALEVFKNKNLNKIFVQALRVAFKRSQELKKLL